MNPANNSNNSNSKIQGLVNRQMQNMTPSIAQYKNYQLQNANYAMNNKGQHRQQQYAQHNEYQTYHDMEDDGQSDLDNTNLYIKGLWKDCTQVELDDLFKQFGVISQSRVYGDGVGFVRFEQGHEAKAAIEAMDKAKLDRCPDQLLVKYAFKKQRPNKRYIRVGDQVKQYDVEMIMNKNTNNVYLRCLPRGFTEPQLKGLCEPFGELTCTRLRESGVAFVRYRKSEDAQHAIRSLNGRRFENHDETLLAKLANSDPFQPKIGFKQKQGFEEEEMSSVAESAHTMTPSQGNMPGAGGNDTMHHSQHQQAQQSQQQQSHQSQHQQPPPQQQQPPQQAQVAPGPGGYNQYASVSQHAPQHAPYHGAYAQQQAQYGQQYDAPHVPVGYNHYLSPNHMSPYDQGTHYNNHYRGIPPGPPPGAGPLPPYPQNYADPNYALQADPNAAAAAAAGAPPGHPVTAYATAPYYATYPYAYYTHAGQPAYVVPAPQAMPPNGAGNNVVPTTSNTAATITSPNAAGSSGQTTTTTSGGTATAVTTNTAVASSSNPSINVNAATTNSNNNNTVNVVQQQQQQQHQQQQQQSQAGNSVTSPTPDAKTNVSATAKTAAVPLFTPPSQTTNGTVPSGITYNPAVNPFIPSVTSPPGSELSFRQQQLNPMAAIGAGSDISSLASHVISDMLHVSKVAVGHDNLGHISPAPQQYAKPNQQWPNITGNAAATATAAQAGTTGTASANSSQTGGIEQALKKLNIVPDNQEVDENNKNSANNPAATSTASSDNKNGANAAIGAMQKMEPMTSNPHHVSKELANKLHSVIYEWYPKKAGKLTGMFLQNHDQDKVMRYLGRPERLKRRIDTFVSLLENQMNKNPETD